MALRSPRTPWLWLSVQRHDQGNGVTHSHLKASGHELEGVPLYWHQDSPMLALWQGRDPRQCLPQMLSSRADPFPRGHSQPSPSRLLKGSCSIWAARQGRCCCSQAWLCCISLPPAQPGDGLSSPWRGSEQTGAPSSGQKAPGSTGATAEQSLPCTRLIPAGDSGSGQQESSPRDRTLSLPAYLSES